MRIPFQQIDAFAERPFGGNPAGVCRLDAPIDERIMQAIAAEMNLSETAFLCNNGDDFDLRWFTPRIEVPLCGHATLATAHMLWETGELDPEVAARFRTKSGTLTARRVDGSIELDFPALPVSPVTAPAGLLDALGVEARFVGQPVHRADFLIEVEDETIVRSVSPDFFSMKALGVRGAIVTARSSSSQWDFVSRFFAPGAGVNEDPVTGSVHCALAPYWAGRLGGTTFVGYQASERGGVVRMRIEGDRVLLAGTAVTVLRGELFV